MSMVTQTTNRIHPLVAVAAISVTVVSLLGIAALTGILPNSHGSVAEAHNAAGDATSLPAQPALPASAAQAWATDTPARKPTARHTTANTQNYAPPPNGQYVQNEVAPTQGQGQPPSQAQYAGQNPGQAPGQVAVAPVQPKPAAAPHNSAVGIGVGALIGGILGSQVGGGNGKTLATIAGAVGGGYVGNEVAKRNQ